MVHQCTEIVNTKRLRSKCTCLFGQVSLFKLSLICVNSSLQFESVNNVSLLQQMRKLKRWIMDNKTHEDSNSFLMNVLCHGNKYGHLLDRNKTQAWDTEEFIGDLSEVETLMAKPKVIIIQACRGSKSAHSSKIFKIDLLIN